VCQLRELDVRRDSGRERIHHQRRIDLPWQRKRSRPTRPVPHRENQVANRRPTQGLQPATKWYRWPGESEPFSVNKRTGVALQDRPSAIRPPEALLLEVDESVRQSAAALRGGNVRGSYPARKYAAEFASSGGYTTRPAPRVSRRLRSDERIVPCWMMALRSLRVIIPIWKNPRYSHNTPP